MKIFDFKLKELEDLNGGDILIKEFKFKGKIYKVEISEYDFNYNFELIVDEDLIFEDELFMDSFLFEYENQNDNGSHIENMVEYLRKSDLEKLNEIIENLNKELIENLK